MRFGFASSSDNLLAQRVQVDNPDVIIIDMESPGRDTLESLESIRRRHRAPL